jgi:hypothetical protein
MTRGDVIVRYDSEVLYLDKDFEIIAEITGQPVEHLNIP